MSKNIISLGQFGPFELSYNVKKDRLKAHADDVTMTCTPEDAKHHAASFPALSAAGEQLENVQEHHEAHCQKHGALDEDGYPEDMPAELKELFKAFDGATTLHTKDDLPEEMLEKMRAEGIDIDSGNVKVVKIDMGKLLEGDLPGLLGTAMAEEVEQHLAKVKDTDKQ